MDQRWTIDAVHAGKRLDVFLTAQLGDVTRSALQKAIRDDQVTVNGSKPTVHRFLKVGDTVVWHKKLGTTPMIKPVKSKSATALAVTNVPIIAETDDWIVVNKPAGMLTHPDRVNNEYTLVDWAIEHCPTVAKVGEDPSRPGIVHRLDREVSGLMIIAKTQRAYENLQQQFRQRTTEKTYLALVHGAPPHDEGDIKFRIARSTTEARMAARPAQEAQGKTAWTHYRVVERYLGATLLEVKILSGRTHQIRAHLHALGCPVVGDKLYVQKKTERLLTAPRLLLQSVGLSFVDLTTGERKVFELSPEPEFERLDARLRRNDGNRSGNKNTI